MGALSARHSCDGRDRHRLAVDHLRRLFDDPAGHFARLPSAHERHPHRRARDRPDLRAVRQLGARRRHADRRHRLRLVGRARRRVRHRRVAAHGHHHADGDVRGAALEAQSAGRLFGQRQPSRARLVVLRLDLDQAPRRRLVSLAYRLRHRLPHADLAQGRGGDGQVPGRASRARRRISSNTSNAIRPIAFRARRSCSAAWPRACRWRSRTTSTATACCRNVCCSSR